ncbi:MAG TPA: MazG-like family protein [Bacillota bacterium]|nr:MazG-like family protein [Bacillota bacterium]
MAFSGGIGSSDREVVSRADIARNIKTIEWLKTELIAGISSLFKGMLKNNNELIADSLANIVVGCYLLGKRLGLPYGALDEKIGEKVKANLEQGHEIEAWYGDFTLLKRYLTGRKT